MGRPTVSVIMGVYNQRDGEALHAAVNSILNQTFRDFEFIIWDDGSCPEAAGLLKKLPELDGRIILAGREENRGLAYSLNGCLSLARGKYIARMDADDVSRPERLEKQVRFLETHGEYAWCGTNTELFDADGTWGRRNLPECPAERDFLRYSPYVHPTVMYRAKVFDANEGYLESEQTLRCEDYEIFMRLHMAGLRGYNLQEYLFCYREDADSYRKRKMRYRINEAGLRYRNYREMGLLFPSGWLYVLRPVIGGLLPGAVLLAVKRVQGMLAGKRGQDGKDIRPKIRRVPAYPAAGAGLVYAGGEYRKTKNAG